MQIIPKYNDSGVFVGNYYHFITEWPLAQAVNDGIDALPLEVDENNEFIVTLKVASDTAKPKIVAPTPVVHTFYLSKAEMIAAGFNSETKMKILIEADGTPVPNNYWVICCCHLEGPDALHLKWVCGRMWIGKVHSSWAEIPTAQ